MRILVLMLALCALLAWAGAACANDLIGFGLEGFGPVYVYDFEEGAGGPGLHLATSPAQTGWLKDHLRLGATVKVASPIKVGVGPSLAWGKPPTQFEVGIAWSGHTKAPDMAFVGWMAKF